MGRGEIEREKRLVSLFIGYYCRHKHGGDVLCDSCGALHDYAMKRLSCCRYGDDKPTCRVCTTHCYQKSYREQIREVMRYCGPRSWFIVPGYSLKHWWRERKFKIK